MADKAKAEEKVDLTAALGVGTVPEPVSKSRDITVEVVRHDARYIDVRMGNEIRRVKNRELAEKHNKLGQKIPLEYELWDKADFAPYAKPKKK